METIKPQTSASRGLKARIGGKLVDAVAIYVGGRTGPNAVAGREILQLVQCDEKLPDVVANIALNLDQLMRGEVDAAAIAQQAPRQAPAFVRQMPPVSLARQTADRRVNQF